MRFLGQIIIGLLLLASQAMASVVAPVNWRQLLPGLAYREVTLHSVGGFSRLHAFRIDLSQYQMALYSAKHLSHDGAYVDSLAKQSKALVAINAGFFTPEQQPLGLRVSQGTLRVPLKPISWWGIFQVSAGKPSIVSSKNYHLGKTVTFAIQSGPILVLNGRARTKLKAGFDERSAVGIDKQGRVLLFVTQNAPIATTELAALLSKPVAKGGFGCVSALNLDGGRSSSLYAKVEGFHLNIKNVSRVAEAITIRRKS